MKQPMGWVLSETFLRGLDVQHLISTLRNVASEQSLKKLIDFKEY